MLCNNLMDKIFFLYVIFIDEKMSSNYFLSKTLNNSIVITVISLLPVLCSTIVSTIISADEHTVIIC